MSDTTGTPAEEAPDTTPTEALQLADQEPVAAVPAAPASAAPTAGSSHTRTILEVVGGVVAAAMIVAAGAVGFAVGHATGDDDGGRWSMTSDSRGSLDGPDAGAPMPGQGRERGHRGDGDGFRGHDNGPMDGRATTPQDGTAPQDGTTPEG